MKSFYPRTRRGHNSLREVCVQIITRTFLRGIKERKKERIRGTKRIEKNEKQTKDTVYLIARALAIRAYYFPRVLLRCSFIRQTRAFKTHALTKGLIAAFYFCFKRPS